MPLTSVLRRKKSSPLHWWSAEEDMPPYTGAQCEKCHLTLKDSEKKNPNLQYFDQQWREKHNSAFLYRGKKTPKAGFTLFHEFFMHYLMHFS